MPTAFQQLDIRVQKKLWDLAWPTLHPVQEESIRHLLGGAGDCIISSPTASGKTEAAFLPILSAIADDTTASVRALYIGPLKALINDQFRRVEDLCRHLDMPVCRWHGDVSAKPKRELLAAPGGVLLITPESLEAMLVLRPTTVPRLFSALSFVVVDEMHVLMGTERGAQLVSQLERVQKRAGCRPVRIGLSATLGDPHAAVRWLRPNGPPATLIKDTSSTSSISIKVRGLWRHAPGGTEQDEHGAGDGTDPSDLELARAILLACGGKTALIFANAKSRIEILADALTTEGSKQGMQDEIVVHHGSLSRERRLYTEERLKAARPCLAVCSNTLELGIDIGEIDEVVQVSAPWSVCSLVQRLGRSGRRAGTSRVLRAFFVEERPTERSDAWSLLHLELVQGLATVELMLEKVLEPPLLGRAHLSTLIHQGLSLIAETGGLPASDLYQRLAACGAFGALSAADFAAVLRELGKNDLIEQLSDQTLILGLAGQRIVDHYSFYAAFNAAEELRVVHGADEIGRVAEPPAVGEHLVLAGRRWRVEDVDAERREVVVVPARGKRPPKFHSAYGNVHALVHARMRALLTSDKVPTYLDSVALEILTDARAEAARQRFFEPRAQHVDGGVRLFLFAGSQVQRTISLVLCSAGLDATDRGVGFDVACGSERAAVALRSFATDPSVVRLAEYADRVQRRRELGPEKLERFVASEVWQKAYAREELDEASAAAMAKELADALSGQAIARIAETERSLEERRSRT